ncbi:hypothetical protein ACIOJE_07575 [Kitasatospora sp. NPDC087861]|uniref:hypothetical protein n=1 Tax=Kitasatospora sp. NPDC087861 TaxID=3364070 RepID=UPI0037F43D7F
MAKLPSDADLSKLFILGATDLELAKKYGVSVQAVNLRRGNLKMGVWSRGSAVSRVNNMVSEIWDVQSHSGAGSHHVTSKNQSLRLYLRMKLKDSLSERQLRTAQLFEARLRREQAVLDYSPDDGFMYVPRVPADERLIVRWPEAMSRPEGEQLELWSLPEE